MISAAWALRQEILRKKHGLFAADHRARPCLMSARIAAVSIWMTTYGRYQRDTETATTERRSIANGGARLVEGNRNGERPTGYR